MDTKNWKYFIVGNIFDTSIAKSIDLLNIQNQGGVVNYIGRTVENNGVIAKVKVDETLIDLVNKGGCLSVVMVGEAGISFYQEKDFLASQNILLLRNKRLNKYSALFISNIIYLEKYRFSYGRTLSKSYFQNHDIKLPAKNGEPDWEFMEDYVKEIYKKIERERSKNSFSDRKVDLNAKDLEWFWLSDIFEFENCKCSNAGSLLKEGSDIYYIGAKKSGNGVMKKVRFDNELTTRGNCIVFIQDGQGSVGYSLYQDRDFIGSITLMAGYNLNLNKYNALFLVSVLDKERFRYSFGRKYNLQQLRKTKIKLPAKNKQPDWDFMENYIKSLPYSSSL